MENSETQVWLDFSLACKYFDSNLICCPVKKEVEYFATTQLFMILM